MKKRSLRAEIRSIDPLVCVCPRLFEPSAYVRDDAVLFPEFLNEPFSMGSLCCGTLTAHGIFSELCAFSAFCVCLLLKPGGPQCRTAPSGQSPRQRSLTMAVRASGHALSTRPVGRIVQGGKSNGAVSSTSHSQPADRHESPHAARHLAARHRPGVSAPGPFDYDTVEIAPNVYGFFEKRLNPIVSSNIVAVIGRDGVLVYDTGHHPTITRQIAGDITPESKPVKYVVIRTGTTTTLRATRSSPARSPAHSSSRTTSPRSSSRVEPTAFEARRAGRISSSRRSPFAISSRAASAPTAHHAYASRQRLEQFAEALDAQVPECDAMVYRGMDRRITMSTQPRPRPP